MKTRFSTLSWFVVAVALLLSNCTSSPVKLEWVEHEGYRVAKLTIEQGGEHGFEAVLPSQTRVEFENTLSQALFLENRHYVNGSGVALGDVDGDGWTDVFLAGLEAPNTLYRNRGNWTFEDITQSAGVGAPNRFTSGAILEDMDGDGDLDLLITAVGAPPAYYNNQGDGSFSLAEDRLGLREDKGGTTIALADVEGDGDLDLYIGAYKKRSIKDIAPPPVRSFDATVRKVGEEYVLLPEFEEHFKLEIKGNRLLRFEYAEPDDFLLNDGAGSFIPVDFTAGSFLDENGQPLTESYEDWALVVRFQDINNDGAPDLYICNDFESPDRFWINDGNGSFREAPTTALRKTSGSTMSVAFSDIDLDTHVDFFLADMMYIPYSDRQIQLGMNTPVPDSIGSIENRPQIMQNMMMRNRGDGTFADIAYLSGLEASGWTWSSLFMDVDLDGYEDLLLTTGHHYNAMHTDVQMYTQRLPAGRNWREVLLNFPPLDQPNVAFRNEGDLTFSLQPAGWGLGQETDVAHGMAAGDLDNDGDLDIVMNRLNAPAGLFKNTSTSSRVAVKLIGAGSNSQAIGAVIRLYDGAVPVQTREAISGGEYLSDSAPHYTFAAGQSGQDMSLEVTWRSGTVTRVEGVQPNHIYEIDEPVDEL